MPAPTYPTSIRLDRDLRRRLRHFAEANGRSLAQHIVFLLKKATPQMPRQEAGKPKSAEGGDEQ